MVIKTELSPEQEVNIADGYMPSVFDMRYALIFERKEEADAVKDILQKLLDEK